MPKPITMTRKDFLKEHKRLLKVLDLGKQLIKEANDQRKEVQKYKKKKGKK